MMTSKRSLLILTLLFPVMLSAQWDEFSISFDDTIGLKHLSIDTASNPNNVWQIGHPDKGLFKNALVGSRCIVTDTINHYPKNDTSSFMVRQVVGIDYTFTYHYIGVSGYYQVNSTNNKDMGYLWYSPDNGKTWVDLINDTLYEAMNCYYWVDPKPVLTGNSGTWQNFRVDVSGFDPVFNIEIGDTMIYKFTFISDSIQDTLDGLMFDELVFEEWTEGIEDFKNIPEISISGNPGPGPYIIDLGKIYPEIELTVYDLSGRKVSVSNFAEQQIVLTAFTGDAGLYMLRLDLGDFNRTLKLIKE